MITLVLGGVRSGKSAVAERIAVVPGLPVTYVATGRLDLGDDAFAARVAAHQARRPADWTTLEVGADLPEALISVEGVALVDSLTTWVAAGNADVDALVDVLSRRAGATVLVSDEVGLGGIAMSEAGRAFADALGTANQRVASVADEVLLVIAGRVLPLEQR